MIVPCPRRRDSITWARSVIADESLVACAPRDKRDNGTRTDADEESDKSSGTDFTDETDSTDLLRGAHDSTPPRARTIFLCARPRDAARGGTRLVCRHQEHRPGAWSTGA